MHVHLIANESTESFDDAARAALAMMDADGIATIVAMSPPRPRASSDFDYLARIAKKYAPRIVVLGGGASLNPMLVEATQQQEVSASVRKRFEETAEAIIAAGARGFGEITAHHVSLLPNHPYEWMPPDHPLYLLLADVAARRGVPIDFHFDPVPQDVSTPSSLSSPRNPRSLKANVAAFERLLAHDRGATIVWAHAGSDPVGYFTPQLARELLGRHQNLMLSIRPVSPMRGGMVHPKLGVNEDWIAVLRAFPDRFVLGSDSFVVAQGFAGSDAPSALAQRAAMQRRGILQLLAYLPPEVARAIAQDNARRIYKLDR